MKMGYDSWSQELRQLRDLIEDLKRRRSLSPAEQDKLDRALRTICNRANWRNEAGLRRIRFAIKAIAEIWRDCASREVRERRKRG